ncbi:hypothetical protein LEP1GSC016_0587 [Leptospira borgpetersenii serovar Hardjo-bovis str. Sponselee]|uniref:Uncharacterized protein n=4 Tax=Leptospira borgpetersenii TaxID=174 RepID=M3GL93_LEPBO|nr:hypothetical protein [Leptospira borgpetersenii]EKP15232.1 hypothetical protein LEP1GSC128_2244 [Leptospira borgpetersenii str. 200801926]EMG01767.1 hypothetical protein LEP1GSC123_0337 [Leptospira borgpetersenii str. 200701203]EMJ85187.1 hypothetical protein LEP1GSC016_0587 [Leptospira borgpetersenii serovar Hardjo-bovis str. Sponselee]EMK12705.1 hypothetical protein LEP1GSC066_3729 [Leptospira sp. serovar Kenya str. Sh9]ENO62265.1 hypothetical protein LEP1GSC191_3170 [Leptospira borgpeter
MQDLEYDFSKDKGKRLYKIKKQQNVIKNSYGEVTVLRHSRILKSIL